MEHHRFGYIRVSSKDQHEGCQLEAMRKWASMNGIFIWTSKVEKLRMGKLSIIETGYSKRRHFILQFGMSPVLVSRSI